MLGSLKDYPGSISNIRFLVSWQKITNSAVLAFIIFLVFLRMVLHLWWKASSPVILAILLNIKPRELELVNGFESIFEVIAAFI